MSVYANSTVPSLLPINSYLRGNLVCMSVVSRAGEACGRWQSSEKKEPLLYVFSGAEKWVKEMVSFSTLYDVYPGLHEKSLRIFFQLASALLLLPASTSSI